MTPRWLATALRLVASHITDDHREAAAAAALKRGVEKHGCGRVDKRGHQKKSAPHLRCGADCRSPRLFLLLNLSQLWISAAGVAEAGARTCAPWWRRRRGFFFSASQAWNCLNSASRSVSDCTLRAGLRSSS